MKKILLFTTLVGLSGLVQATTINAPSSLIGSSALSGNNAYQWGISIAVPTGQTITAAEIDFTNIKLTSTGSGTTGTLWVDLLNSQTPANGVVTSAVDSDAAGDYWATKFSGANITSLGSKVFTLGVNVPTLAFVFTTPAQLAALNALAAGGFTIGLDPDCTYSVGGLTFNYTLGPKTNSVPDGAMTAFLVVISLAGLEVFRRQFAMAHA